ncbi:molybdenum cofactor guanylyltransferase [Nonomuraea salmonea]|uniref:molybdenum cofactor guanylyltransferase n=1 Tax=Nonomuraea salmonea TaxID=46181 RepID=UPI0031EC50B2
MILAGGRARRLGGADKPALTVGGRPLVEHVIAAVSGAGAIVVAGPERRPVPGVVYVREEPPGSGPVPALAAALPHLTSGWVVLLAGDLPFMGGGPRRRAPSGRPRGGRRRRAPGRRRAGAVAGRRVAGGRAEGRARRLRRPLTQGPARPPSYASGSPCQGAPGSTATQWTTWRRLA